jgi:hypothetical protein
VAVRAGRNGGEVCAPRYRVGSEGRPNRAGPFWLFPVEHPLRTDEHIGDSKQEQSGQRSEDNPRPFQHRLHRDTTRARTFASLERPVNTLESAMAL